MRKRLQRSSGTAITARDVLRTYRQDSRETASAADIAAIEQGEGRTLFCHYRGSYGSYPKRFAGCMLDLTSDGPVIRPMLFLRFLWQRIPISERVISAEVRPFGSEREAFQLASTGQFARGRRLEQSGYAVICCHTFGGVLEFAVRRPDVDLVLRFFHREAEQARSAVTTDDAKSVSKTPLTAFPSPRTTDHAASS